jgi:hypothetical protein
LKRIALKAFTKQYDPYWDIPLDEDLPVIELPPLAERFTPGETTPRRRGKDGTK